MAFGAALTLAATVFTVSLVVEGSVGLCEGWRKTSSCERISSAAAGGGRSGAGGEITLFLAALGAAGLAEKESMLAALVGVNRVVAPLEEAGAGEAAAVITEVVVAAAPAEPLRRALVTSNKEFEAEAVSPELAKAEAALMGCISRKAGRKQPFEVSHRPES